MASLFSSDPHHGHVNIIKYCKRPTRCSYHAPVPVEKFEPCGACVTVMNRVLREKWNARVGPRDTVYLLGDVAMGDKSRLPEIRKSLNGRIVLIRGNHDKSKEFMLAAGFDEVHDELYLEEEISPGDEKVSLYLKHIPDVSPQALWRHKADYHLAGHVHEAWQRRGNVINVGVDVWDMQPVTLKELLGAKE